MQRVRLRAVIAEGDVIKFDLRRTVHVVVGMRFAGAVMLRPVQKGAEITDRQADAVPFGQAVDERAHPRRKRRDRCEIQYELIDRDLAADEERDEQRIGSRVADENQHEVGQPAQEHPQRAAAVPPAQLARQIVPARPQPAGHAVYTDVLGCRERAPARNDVIEPRFNGTRLFIRAVRPAVIGARGQPAQHRRNGQKRNQPHADQRHHRAERQIARDVLQHAEARVEYVVQRLNTVPLLRRPQRAVGQITRVLLLIVLIEHGQRLARVQRGALPAIDSYGAAPDQLQRRLAEREQHQAAHHPADALQRRSRRRAVRRLRHGQRGQIHVQVFQRDVHGDEQRKAGQPVWRKIAQPMKTPEQI